MSCGGTFLTVYLLVSASLIDHVRLEPKNVKEQSVLVLWLGPQNSESTNRSSKDQPIKGLSLWTEFRKAQADEKQQGAHIKRLLEGRIL